MNTTPEIIARLKEYMLENKKNQMEIAEELGVSQPLVSKWLGTNKTCAMRGITAKKLCELLGLDYVSEECTQLSGGIANINTAEHGTAIQNNSFHDIPRNNSFHDIPRQGIDVMESRARIFQTIVQEVMALKETTNDSKVQTIQILNRIPFFSNLNDSREA